MHTKSLKFKIYLIQVFDFLPNSVKKLSLSMQLTNKKIFLKKKNFSHKKSIKYFY